MYTMQNVKGLNNAAVYLSTAHSMTVEEIKTEHIGHRKKYVLMTVESMQAS